MGKISFIFFNLDTSYTEGGVNHPFRWTFSRLIYHIYIFLYCLTVVCHCIHVMYNFKGKYAEKEAIVEREACFPLNFPNPHLALVTFKDDALQQNCYHNLTVRRT